MKMVQQQQAHENPFNMYYNQIWLKDPLYRDSLQKFPLGLYMSDGAAEKLKIRAKQVTTINVELMDTLNYYFRKL
jgi:hypothetical protein